MTEYDPLAVLTGDDPPVRPDPAFAARLRARLESAMSPAPGTEGATVTNTETIAAPRPAALPYLTVADASAALAWYVDALGAVVVGEPIAMADGRIGHAELALAGGVLYLADEFPEMGLKGPVAQAVSVSLLLSVADTDATLARARDRGASVQREPYENHGARTATIIDPFGHRWMLSGPALGSVPQIRHGDIGYVSMWTADPARSAAFYRHVLGWAYDAESRRVTNAAQPIGIVAAAGPPTLFCCYAVADAVAARQAILDAGGTAGEITMDPHGPTVEGTDPFGTAFAVYQPVAANPRPALNGAGPGELSYVTYQVPDSAAFREFYGRVLGWSFDPGRIDDGWEPRSVHPMAGVAGGSAEPVTVPMWTVADVVAAVQRVNDPQVMRVTIGSAALCATGWEN